MKDQLSVYTLPPAKAEALLEEDFLTDRDICGELERRAKFIGDLYLDDGSIGDLVGPITQILGAPVDGLLGRSGMGIPPLGPSLYTSKIDTGDLQIILKTLDQARSILNGRTDGVPEDRVERLREHAKTCGGASQCVRDLRQIMRLLERVRNTSDTRFVTFCKW